MKHQGLRQSPQRRRLTVGAAFSEYIGLVMGIAVAVILAASTFGGVTQEHGSTIAMEMAGKEGEPDYSVSSGSGYRGGGGAFSGGRRSGSGPYSGPGGSNNPGPGGGGPGSNPGNNSGGIGGGTNTGGPGDSNDGPGTNTGNPPNPGGGNGGGIPSDGPDTDPEDNPDGVNDPGTDPDPDPGTDPGTDPDSQPDDERPLFSADNLIDFADGLWEGLKTQGEGLWYMITHPIETATNFYTLGKALIVDPVGTLELIAQEFKGDIDAVLSGDAREIGRVIGENVSPAAIARLAGRLSGIARRFDDDNPDIRCGRRSSFVGDTMIWTDNGLRPISEISVGDRVLARSDANYHDGYQAVTELYGRKVSHYYEVQFDNLTIKTTDEHPFWQQAKGWVKAEDLVKGEVVATQSSDLTVRRVERIEQPAEVFNFSVANDHTYFVGKYGMWVHNQNGECDIDRPIGAADIRDRLNQDARSRNPRVDGPAVSRGAAYDRNGNLIEGPDTPYTNLDHGRRLLADNPNTQISGIRKSPDGDTFEINDVDAYMDDVRRLYSESGEALHPDTERLIRQHIQSRDSFDTIAGPPGTHAEVRTLNNLYTQAGGKDNITEAFIGTQRTGSGADFPACSNCGGIIGQDSNVTIITD